MSDFSDSETEVDIIDEIFTLATENVQRIHSTVDPNDLLELYGLYKQATTGRCNVEKPNIFNMQGRAKWSAWNDLKGMPVPEAKRLYVEKVKNIDPNWWESVEKGEKPKANTGWAVHSTEQPPEDLLAKSEHEKNSFDYLKEGNLARLKETLSQSQLQQLDENGMGLIHWATDRNLKEILEFLLVSGVDINMRDAEQQTALHYAASCGHVDCVHILLKYKADRLVKDSEGKTCLDVADNGDVVALLNNCSV